MFGEYAHWSKNRKHSLVRFLGRHSGERTLDSQQKNSNGATSVTRLCALSVLVLCMSDGDGGHSAVKQIHTCGIWFRIFTADKYGKGDLDPTIVSPKPKNVCPVVREAGTRKNFPPIGVFTSYHKDDVSAPRSLFRGGKAGSFGLFLFVKL